MKTFKFEITLSEKDLMGDEFWEEALEKDGTGITDLTEAIKNSIQDSNLITDPDFNYDDIIKLVSYENK